MLPRKLCFLFYKISINRKLSNFIKIYESFWWFCMILQIYISSNSRNILLLEIIFLYVISWFGGDFGIQIWFHLNILVESPSIVPHHGNDFAKCQIIFHHGKNILPCSYWFWYDFINLKIYLLILVESFHHLTHYILIFKIFRLERLANESTLLLHWNRHLHLLQLFLISNPNLSPIY